ncbi:MAG: hypothetical protein NUV97_02195 [archaeon]|nr:hypothetical protein [archaeon]MCR4323760.1 hypothetical protein [Nanoarchaeota archaeon]
MAINVREEDIEDIKERLKQMQTPLNKINYLESALKISGFDFETKRFLWKTLSELYEERKMFERAAKAMSNKAGIEIIYTHKVESHLSAAELYARAGRVEDADEMFTRAGRDANIEQKARIKLTQKNIYMTMARELEKKGKRATAAKFYERVIKMNLEGIEKEEIKTKLILTYKALGMFREAKLIEGL